MSGHPPAGGQPSGVRPEGGDIRALLERIMASNSFRRSPRLREMLGFIMKCSLEGREHELNEYSLGVQVFGKPVDYTPSQDNIVRVTARQMRIKLAEYYAGDGKQEPWRLEVPRGGYLPRFVPAGSEAEPPIQLAKVPGWARALMAGLAILAAAGLSLSGWLIYSGRQRQAELGRNLLQGMLGDRGAATTIVLDDPLLPRLWTLSGRHISLEDLLQNRYLDKQLYQGTAGEEMRRVAASIQVTSSESMRLVGHMYRVAGGAGQQLYVQHCRNMQANELERGNLIFVGGVGANPWVYLLQKGLNFEHVIRPKVNRTFINRQPKPGEPAEYVAPEQGPAGKDRYARIAVLKNPLGNGRVALIAGTTKESTEAAGEFALSAAAYEQVKGLCGVSSLTDLSSFELLLKSSTVGGASLSTRVVAHRCNGK